MSILDSKAHLTPQSQARLENVKSVFFNIGKRALDSQNPFKSYQHDENMKLSVSKLNDEQVQASQIYHNLISKIQQLNHKKQVSHLQHQQRIKDIDQTIKYKKQSIHQCKFHAWELKNQIMALQQQLADELQENHEIEKWFCGEAEEGEENALEECQQEQVERDQEGGQNFGQESEESEVLSRSMRTLPISCSDV